MAIYKSYKRRGKFLYEITDEDVPPSFLARGNPVTTTFKIIRSKERVPFFLKRIF